MGLAEVVYWLQHAENGIWENGMSYDSLLKIILDNQDNWSKDEATNNYYGGGLSVKDLKDYLKEHYTPFIQDLFRVHMIQSNNKLYWNMGLLYAGLGAETDKIEMYACYLKATQERVKVHWGRWACYKDGFVVSDPITV